jgi:hypothetical protein
MHYLYLDESAITFKGQGGVTAFCDRGYGMKFLKSRLF